MSLTHVIHRIASDPSFAHLFSLNPASALASAQLELNNEELAAVQALMRRPGWQKLCRPAEAEIESYPWVAVQRSSPEACSNT